MIQRIKSIHKLMATIVLTLLFGSIALMFIKTGSFNACKLSAYDVQVHFSDDGTFNLLRTGKSSKGHEDLVIVKIVEVTTAAQLNSCLHAVTSQTSAKEVVLDYNNRCFAFILFPPGFRSFPSEIGKLSGMRIGVNEAAIISIKDSHKISNLIPECDAYNSKYGEAPRLMLDVDEPKKGQ